MKTILIIEDEHDIVDLYSDLLSTEGYEVIKANDGETGLLKAQTINWDILLLDIMLPKKDGLEILTILKSQDKYKNKPIILLTNLDKESILQSCLELGANKYIVKSNVTPQEIVAEVFTQLKGEIY